MTFSDGIFFFFPFPWSAASLFSSAPQSNPSFFRILPFLIPPPFLRHESVLPFPFFYLSGHCICNFFAPKPWGTCFIDMISPFNPPVKSVSFFPPPPHPQMTFRFFTSFDDLQLKRGLRIVCNGINSWMVGDYLFPCLQEHNVLPLFPFFILSSPAFAPFR